MTNFNPQSSKEMVDRLEAERERQKQEMSTHLTDLADTCMNLLAARDPWTTINTTHKLRSLVGQIENAGRRFLRLSS